MNEDELMAMADLTIEMVQTCRKEQAKLDEQIDSLELTDSSKIILERKKHKLIRVGNMLAEANEQIREYSMTF